MVTQCSSDLMSFIMSEVRTSVSISVGHVYVLELSSHSVHVSIGFLITLLSLNFKRSLCTGDISLLFVIYIANILPSLLLIFLNFLIVFFVIQKF